MVRWMSNWQYANDVPTSPWRSATSIPRELKLKAITEGVRVVQTPVKELETIRGTSKKWKNLTISPASHNVLAGQSGDAYEINAEFKVSPGSAAEFGFKVRTGENQFTKVGYDRRNAKLFVDRSESGNNTFNPTLTPEKKQPH